MAKVYLSIKSPKYHLQEFDFYCLAFRHARDAQPAVQAHLAGPSGEHLDVKALSRGVGEYSLFFTMPVEGNWLLNFEVSNAVVK